jgi:hypothetical protein
MGHCGHKMPDVVPASLFGSAGRLGVTKTHPKCPRTHSTAAAETASGVAAWPCIGGGGAGLVGDARSGIIAENPINSLGSAFSNCFDVSGVSGRRGGMGVQASRHAFTFQYATYLLESDIYPSSGKTDLC